MTQTNTIEFGTDGIRGVAGEFPLDPATVLQIGRAIGVWLQRTGTYNARVLIGRDTRISGQMLAAALSAGLLAEGVQVADSGIISTPGVAHLTRSNNFALGIVISASHNPFEQNGIKLFGANGFKLDDAAEEAIETLISQPNVEAAHGIGTLTTFDGREKYIAHLIEGIDLRSLSVVLDCANGAAFEMAPQAFRRAGATVHTINTQCDGYSINVSAGSEHVRRDRNTLVAEVQQHGADLGVAFDGDADRVIFVTPDGMLIDGDHVLGILALELQAQEDLPGATVVATDMSNSGLEHFLAEHGIRLSRTKVGDRYVMERLREQGYRLGGEQAGHIIILDSDHTAGDGIFAALYTAHIVAGKKRSGGATLAQLAAQIPRYPQVIASAHLKARIELSKVEGLKEATDATLARFEGKGRVNLRFSGTEPNLLRAMVEGGAHNTLQQTIDAALQLCSLVAKATHTENPQVDMVDCVTGEPIHLG
ncbi:MAG: phosphoglucosamine mutase [Anaerolineae bacterium]